MDAPTELIGSLRSIVGDAHVLTDPSVVASHVTDWTGRFTGTTPAVVRPSTTEEVAAVIGACRRHGAAVVPQGGNTGLVGGSVPLAGEIVLSSQRMVGVHDVDDAAGQLTAWAGTTLADVQAAARDAGWRYGIDLAARDSATIGGTVATNAGGTRVLRFGHTRHQLLGVEAVLGTGEIVRRLGGLVKDNTGYDLAGLLCGSEGTLGYVCRVRLALVAPAGEAVTALVGFGTVAEAVRAVGVLRRSIAGLEAAELVLASGAELVADQTGTDPVFDPLPPVHVLVEAVGPPDPSDALAAAIDALPGVVAVAVATDPVRARRLWHVREAHTESIARVGTPRKYDVTLPASRLADFVDSITARVDALVPGSTTWLFGHVGDGNVHVNITGAEDPSYDDVVDRAVLAEVIDRGGSISAEHGIGTAKRAWLAQDRTPADVSVMRAIKAGLDPDGVMNPDVLFAPARPATTS